MARRGVGLAVTGFSSEFVPTAPGLITEGAHHQPHHLAMAKGAALAGHIH